MYIVYVHKNTIVMESLSNLILEFETGTISPTVIVPEIIQTWRRSVQFCIRSLDVTHLHQLLQRGISLIVYRHFPGDLLTPESKKMFFSTLRSHHLSISIRLINSDTLIHILQICVLLRIEDGPILSAIRCSIGKRLREFNPHELEELYCIADAYKDSQLLKKIIKQYCWF